MTELNIINDDNILNQAQTDVANRKFGPRIVQYKYISKPSVAYSLGQVSFM